MFLSLQAGRRIRRGRGAGDRSGSMYPPQQARRPVRLIGRGRADVG
jgi:hypothetical protein